MTNSHLSHTNLPVTIHSNSNHRIRAQHSLPPNFTYICQLKCPHTYNRQRLQFALNFLHSAQRSRILFSSPLFHTHHSAANQQQQLNSSLTQQPKSLDCTHFYHQHIYTCSSDPHSSNNKHQQHLVHQRQHFPFSSLYFNFNYSHSSHRTSMSTASFTFCLSASTLPYHRNNSHNNTTELCPSLTL